MPTFDPTTGLIVAVVMLALQYFGVAVKPKPAPGPGPDPTPTPTPTRDWLHQILDALLDKFLPNVRQVVKEELAERPARKDDVPAWAIELKAQNEALLKALAPPPK